MMQKRPREPGRPGAYIVGLLAVLGLDYSVPKYLTSGDRLMTRHINGRHAHRFQSFWIRHEENLEFILAEAHLKYRELVKEIRPDLTENHEAGAQLTLAWSRIKDLFERHGITL